MVQYKMVDTRHELLAVCDREILNEAHSNVFASIDIGGSTLGLSWNGSRSIEIQEFPELGLIFIGAGESVLSIDGTSGIVRLAFGLGFPFQFIVRTNDGLAIVSELTIVLIRPEDCSITRFIVASDIIQDVVVEDDKLLVQCLDSSFVV